MITDVIKFGNFLNLYSPQENKTYRKTMLADIQLSPSLPRGKDDQPIKLVAHISGNGHVTRNNTVIDRSEIGITVADLETRNVPAEKDFDPFKERKVKNPTTDRETLTHLLLACLGSGIFTMPKAFKNAGLVVGVFGTIIVAFLCTHCSYVLVKCAHTLYYRTRKTKMSFAEVAEASFSTGPKWARPLAKWSRYFIQICLFITYFGGICAYTIIVSKNFLEVVDQYYPNVFKDWSMTALLLFPALLLSYIPNLKLLARISVLPNTCMVIGIGITVFEVVKGISADDSSPKLAESISDFPDFLSATIFAVQAIGVIMPLENNMKTPQNFVGICGVLNRGMSGITAMYITIGFLGYYRYGKEVKGFITLSLPKDEILSQIARVLIGIAVLCAFALQFSVCFNIVWNGIKDRCRKRLGIANYALRTVMVVAAVSIAAVVPTITPVIGLLGAFCFSILGLMIPVFIETVTYWESGFGLYNWIAIKNCGILVIGSLVLVFGTRSSIREIIESFS